MSRLSTGLLSVLAIMITACSVAREPVNSPSFIKTDGQRLVQGDERYIFLGTNLWYAANLAAESQRERLVRELDQLQALGITNLRILGASEGSGSRRVRRTFQPRPGVYDDSLLVGLDFVLAELGKRDMHAVIYLNNYWVWSGGMAQYAAWVRDEDFPNPFLEAYTWPQFMSYSASFYCDSAAVALNRAYLQTIIGRTNTISGMAYVDDPTIMAWQLANEPRPGLVEEAEANRACYLGWLEQTAGVIRKLDPNHLISTGSEGIIGSGLREDIYLQAHALANIDYLTFHVWAKNWNWFDPLDAVGTWPETVERANAYLSDHFAYARQLNKPIVLEEFGFPRDGGAFAVDSPVSWRNRYFKIILEGIYREAAGGGPAAGSNFWAWGGEGRAADSSYVWQVGEDYVGDPPQEPQGLYSVFDSDTSTIDLLRMHAERIRALR